MNALMLRPDAQSLFRRTVRDGESVRTLVFERGVPVVLGDADFAGVRADVGKALVLAVIENGVVQAKPDWKRTGDEVELMKLEAEEAGKPAKRKKKDA
jgi:hypothetical protein